MRSGGGDLDLDRSAQSTKRTLNLADVGTVVRVGELANGGLAETKPAGKFNLRDALVPHCREERKFCGNDGGHRHSCLTRERRAWLRDVPLLVHITGQSGRERIFGQSQDFGSVGTAGDGLRDVRESGNKAAILIGFKDAGVFVDHRSEVLSVDLKLTQHRGNESPG